MKPDFSQFMEKAKQLQENLQKAQDAAASAELKGEAGAGLVSVVVTGDYHVKRVSIDPSLLADDKEMLEDLVAAAFNDAIKQVERSQKDRMGSMMSGLGMPFNLK